MAAIQALSPPPPDPTQRTIMMALPFVFMFVFGGFAAGLVLYWVWSNVPVAVAAIFHHATQRGRDAVRQADQAINRAGLINPGRIDESDAPAFSEEALEAGRKLCVGPVEFVLGAASLHPAPSRKSARNRLCRTVQCRQIVADQCVLNRKNSGAVICRTRQNARAQLFRCRPRQALARRFAGLWLCESLPRSASEMGPS